MTIERVWYQITNWKAHLRAWWLGRKVIAAGGQVYKGLLQATAIRCGCGHPEAHVKAVCPMGRRVALGTVGRRVVTNAGVAYMAQDFNAATGGADVSNFNYHDSGTGTNAENVTDTALQTAAGPARVAGTQSNPAGGQYRTVATITYAGTQAITEHGLFSASTVGTLWDRTVFSAINVNSGDSIQFTYTLTCNAGG